MIPGLEISPGEGNGYPLQYSGLERSMNCMHSPWGHKKLDTTEQLSLHFISVENILIWLGLHCSTYPAIAVRSFTNLLILMIQFT